MRTEDGYIIQQCLDGNAAAFGFLVNKYKDPVYALAYSQVHNFHDAQDITQEVFIKAYRKLSDLRRWDNFMGWLCRITNNMCKNWLRSRARRPDLEFVDDQDPGILDRSSIDSYHGNMVYESIHYALDSLPELYSQVLILRYFGGMTTREMSRFLAVSTSTIERRLKEARSQLREGMFTMMNISYEQHELPATFTFRIVEAVKRIKINPTPRMAGVPWALSLAMGIIITVLSLNPHISIPRDMAIPTGSPLPVERRVLKIGEIPVDILRVVQASVTSSKQEDGSIEDKQLPNPQNALLMAPHDKEAADVKLTAEDTVAGDKFGRSVATYGDYAIVGAIGRDWEKGVAYILKAHGTSWEQEAELSTEDVVNLFGYSVDIYGDYAIVGAAGSLSVKGAAYIFKRDGTSWEQEAKFTAKDVAKGDYFGEAVAILGDYAVVGAPWDDDKGKNTGSVYFFKRDGNSWSEEAKFTPHGQPISNCSFGTSIDISGDYVIVGSVYENWSSGAAYIFHYDGDSWAEEAKFTAKDNARQDNFGHAVSMDGDYAIVGATGDKDKGNMTGSAYIFKREDASWKEQAKLTASDAVAGDRFGSSVNISGDCAIVGSVGDGDDSIYVFLRSGTSWEAVSKYTPNDSAAEDRFGCSISTSGDYVIIGAYWADAKGVDSGAVYIRNLKDLSLPGKAVEPQGKLPTRWGRVKRTELYQNYPNPFNPETWIPFDLSEPKQVTIRIYRSTGQLIRTLDLGQKPSGTYVSKDKAAYWDGRNEAGEEVASDVYFCAMQAGEFTSLRKIVMTR